MKGKLRIIILVAIAVTSFGISYLVTPWLGGQDAPAPEPGVQEKQSGIAGPDGPVAVPAGAVSHLTIALTDTELRTMIRELRLKMEIFRTKEEEQARRKKHIMIAEEDLKKQIQELEKLRLALIPIVQDIRKEQQDMEATRTRFTAEEEKNLKSDAGTYDVMSVESAAKIFAVWCAGTQEQEDHAVKILYYMQARSRAKLLAAMDPKIAAPLSERLKTIQKPPKKA